MGYSKSCSIFDRKKNKDITFLVKRAWAQVCCHDYNFIYIIMCVTWHSIVLPSFNDFRRKLIEIFSITHVMYLGHANKVTSYLS